LGKGEKGAQNACQNPFTPSLLCAARPQIRYPSSLRRFVTLALQCAISLKALDTYFLTESHAGTAAAARLLLRRMRHSLLIDMRLHRRGADLPGIYSFISKAVISVRLAISSSVNYSHRYRSRSRDLHTERLLWYGKGENWHPIYRKKQTIDRLNLKILTEACRLSLKLLFIYFVLISNYYPTTRRGYL
jgi:hypothetical protein